MIDLYCERLGPGLWAEPINAFTNLSFLFAAYAGWRIAARHQSLSPSSYVLITLMVAIGIGSGLFHTFATRWAQILDILPILFFQLAYLWIYGRKIIKMRSSLLASAVAVYLVVAVYSRQFPHMLNGSLIYAPAFVLLLVLGIYHYRHANNERSILLIATGVFVASLFFRSIDQMACSYIPIGTHFFWHLFNGLLVFLAFRGLVLSRPDRKEGNA